MMILLTSHVGKECYSSSVYLLRGDHTVCYHDVNSFFFSNSMIRIAKFSLEDKLTFGPLFFPDSL